MMKKILASLLLVASCASPVAANQENYNKMQKEMLDPAVQVQAASGTIISTADNSIYVLTAQHVIDRFIEQDNFGEGSTVEVRSPVDVKFFSNNEETVVRKARIVAYSKYSDLALLQVTDKELEVEGVAVLKDEDESVVPFQDSWSIGSALGEFPFPTAGIISDINFPIDSVSSISYTLSSAPIIFGNSGGGLYTYDEEDSRYELSGVNVMVRTARTSTFAPPVPITHMAVAVPTDVIHNFLRENGWEEILESE